MITYFIYRDILIMLKASVIKNLKFYEQMLLIRRFEESCAKAYALRKIKGFCHLYIGEESVAVGAIGSLETQDYVLATYREHGHAIAKGVEPNFIMAELFGKETGVSKGLGGSMHLFDIDKKFMGGHGIVGAHIALAAGVAFASQYRRERSVTLCFVGEGAVSIGGFHEGVSLAALWGLPVVFIIENNQYSMGTPLHRHIHLQNISQKGEGYGIPHKQIDAANVMDVYETVKEAVNRARGEQGPSLLEMITYRYRGHSMSDPAKYRTSDEVKNAKQKDPISISKAQLLQEGVEKKDLEIIETRSKKKAIEAVEFADQSAFTSPINLKKFVFSNRKL